jgi:hypothetical protein
MTDMCINGCRAYTGDSQADVRCTCGESRYDSAVCLAEDLLLRTEVITPEETTKPNYVHVSS